MRIINQELINAVSNEAKASERRRKNYNFHTESNDLLQRMLNAVEPFSYVCPHKHENPSKREAFIILRGAMLIVIFDYSGKVTQHTVLSHQTGNLGIEIPAATYHTIIALEPDTVVYEVKDGPYHVSSDKGFAPWAPAEGSVGCEKYLTDLLAQLGYSIA